MSRACEASTFLETHAVWAKLFSLSIIAYRLCCICYAGIAESMEKFEISNEMDEILIIKPEIFLDIFDKFLY